MIEMLAVALAPIFFGLLLGYFAGVRKIVDNINVGVLMSFVMTFALPCALFLVIVKVQRAVLWSQGRTIVLLVIAYMLIFAATYYYGRKVLRQSPSDAAVLSMTVSFPNITAVGIPLLDGVYGSQTGILIAVSLAIGSLTISPVGLAILEDATPSGHARRPFLRWGRAFLRAARRPVIWAPAAGLLAVLCNVGLPVYVQRSLNVMGAATAGGALFLTGLIISAQRFSLNLSVLLCGLAKNVVQPAICFALALAFGMPVETLRWVVLITAIPCGFFGIVFGKGFDATPRSASSSLAFSYLLSVISLAGWIVLLGRLR